MKRLRSFIFFIAIFGFLSVVKCGYSEEAIPPEGAAETEPAASEEKTPYVKPGYVTVNFKDADIRVVLNYLSEVSGVDIVPSPDVTGAISLKLTDKPWQTALNIIVKNYGFAYEREGDIIRVVTIASLKLEELVTEVIPLSYIAAESAKDAVKDVLSPRGKLSFDSRVNALIVSDIATNIYRIKQIVALLDMKTPQVMIEAKIIETTLDRTERLGIDWNLVIAAAGASRPITFPFSNWGNINLLGHELNKYYPLAQPSASTAAVAAGGAVETAGVTEFPTIPEGSVAFPFVDASDFAYGTLNFTQFGAVLEYLKSRSDTDIISNPRITTLNNKQAKIFVGRIHPYISEISEDEDKTTYEYKEKEIGITLLVTPHVNKSGDIEVEVEPKIEDLVGYEQLTAYFRLPVFSTREAKTQVMIRDMDTIFIGGLIKENVTKYDKKFPILGDLLGGIPFLGNMFKYEREEKEKTELIFFLTVHIVQDVDTLTRVALKDMSEVTVPMDIQEKVFEPIIESPRVGVTRKLPSAIHKKEHKPLFDLRKKKKNK